MFGTIELPLWLFSLILLFAAVTAASHLFIPPVRWFFRRRLERAVERLNQRLERPIQPMKLLRRQDMILRLSYDPVVLAAVADHAAETGVREDVVHTEARRYAREIVPSFSATAYFGFGIRFARALSRWLYDVEVLNGDDPALSGIDQKATVVFVMNHRSNMDYVLVTYLAADRSALSYAVGEWAQIWPLSALLRSMGAYFIRRRSRNDLYRAVLARYVQIAVAGGVTQAIFPEGNLSLDGRIGTARLGLLSYLVEGQEAGGRDIVFVPVTITYDRVMEDNVLLAAERQGRRNFRGSFPKAAIFTLRWLWRRLVGRVGRFGKAAVVFGTPLSLSGDMAGADVKSIGVTLTGRLRQGVAVLPVPLVSAALLEGARGHDLVRSVAQKAAAAKSRGLTLCMDETRTEEVVGEAMRIFRMRGIVDRDGEIAEREKARDVLEFYAATLSDAAIEGGPKAAGDGAASS